jgi:hypothetical protein
MRLLPAVGSSWPPAAAVPARRAATDESQRAHDQKGARDGSPRAVGVRVIQDRPTSRLAPAPRFDHLRRLTDANGLFEHADGIVPRRDGGYCLDDVARALVVVCRQRPTSDALDRLAAGYLAFVIRAQDPDGRCRNRLDRLGRWEDAPATGDWWGRALWGLGTASVRGPESIRADAAGGFDRSVSQRSPHMHAMAFAVLGAAEVLVNGQRHPAARRLLSDFVVLVGPGSGDATWPWPQPRLTYANAAIAEALIAAGAALGDRAALDHGLGLLGWLLEVETSAGHLSVTPVGGWGPGEHRARFDQQPIEAAALADACARALDVTGDTRWANALRRAIGWFVGDNDNHTLLYDPVSGGGFDALTPAGRNTNQGAESTLALVSTMQHGDRLGSL